MRILITGNLGYAGLCVVRQFRETWPDARLIGVDPGDIEGGAISPECRVDQQINADIRELPPGLFNGIGAVVHLASLSDSVVEDTDYRATMEIARRAKKAGVKSFVFASSCDVYGPGSGTPRTEASELNPVTLFARCKAATESGLRTLAGRDFTITCLRFAGVCGMSPRFSPDGPLNSLLASAVSRHEIRVSGDGMSIRPLIHVRDMARSIDWAVARPSANGGAFLVVNAGSDAWTRSEGELAAAVASTIPGTKVLMSPTANRTERSCKIDFSLFRRLAPLHQPREQLTPSILEIRDALEGCPGQSSDVAGSVRGRFFFEMVDHNHGQRTPALREFQA